MHDVAWRGMWICVRSKDAQKQLARTSLKTQTFNFFHQILRQRMAEEHSCRVRKSITLFTKDVPEALPWSQRLSFNIIFFYCANKKIIKEAVRVAKFANKE